MEEARVLACDWGVNGGQLEYDISYLHPDWDLLIQSYRIDTTDYEGRPIYTSEFLLFKQGEAEPSDFSAYPKERKVELWKVVFAVKRKFFEEIEPALVVHFIKQPISVAHRYRLYSTYLALPNYRIDRTAHDIIYTRLASVR